MPVVPPAAGGAEIEPARLVRQDTLGVLGAHVRQRPAFPLAPIHLDQTGIDDRVDAQDRRLLGQAQQAFAAANAAGLKNNTYLETKNGKRLFLDQYVPPGNDGMGAKFVFPRIQENEPFVTESSGFVRFYSEISKDIRLNMRFKISDMMYDGNLEY